MDGDGLAEKPGKLFHLIWLSFGFHLALVWFGLVWFGYSVYITIIVVQSNQALDPSIRLFSISPSRCSWLACRMLGWPLSFYLSILSISFYPRTVALNLTPLT